MKQKNKLRGARNSISKPSPYLKKRAVEEVALRKNPITRNEGFTCKKCRKENPEAIKTCRNHCRYCLYSQHVDLATPGDRQSECGGFMEPILIDYTAKKGYRILHECEKCHEKKFNKAAEDDNQEEIIKIMQRQNLQ